MSRHGRRGKGPWRPTVAPFHREPQPIGRACSGVFRGSGQSRRRSLHVNVRECGCQSATSATTTTASKLLELRWKDTIATPRLSKSKERTRVALGGSKKSKRGTRIPGVEPGADEAIHSLEVRVIDVTATPYPMKSCVVPITVGVVLRGSSLYASFRSSCCPRFPLPFGPFPHYCSKIDSLALGTHESRYPS